MQQPILLVGVSVRMLAELSVRAGYDVVALDYFGDADLRAICASVSILRDIWGRYSAAALADAAHAIRAPAVVYSASLENHPEQVARLAHGRELLGNSPATLAQVRDPLRLGVALRQGGFAFPETLPAAEVARADRARRWLVKPYRSGGGHGIRAWRGAPLAPDQLLQARVAGRPCSAAFVADGERAVLLGLSGQLVGRRAFGAGGFRYCGNILPPPLPDQELRALLTELRALAEQLTQAFGLRGLNGLDVVWDGRRAWTLEVNPRPSASLELIERAYGLSVFDAHVRACTGELPRFELEAAHEAGASAKAIIYARHDLTAPDTAGWHSLGRRDIPHRGEQIRKGHPVCTLLADAATPRAAERRLRTMALELWEELRQ